MSRVRRPTTLPERDGAGRRQRQSQDSVRAAAAWVLERTLASLAPAETYLTSTQARFDERDRGLLHELVLGSLRWLRRLDGVLEAASSRRLEEIDPALRAPLRIAAYQLLFLDRIPAHAVVNEAVEQASRVSHRGGAAFTNAVLRRLARSPRLADWPVTERDPVRRLGIELSHPDLLVERWLSRFGRERTERLLAANNRAKPLTLLAFRDRGGRELLAERLIEEGVDVEPSALAPLGLVVRSGNPFGGPAFTRGDFYVQDEASQASALLPPPRPGERILDVAAAPGGKSFALLSHEPRVKLTLADVDIERLGVLAANLRRLGRRLPLVAADGTAPPFAGEFDRVVVDLPCSGTGTLRKHPELKWRISADEIGRLAAQAEAMLAAAAPRVAPGGLLVAITCSLEAEENEDVVAAFRARFPELVPVELEAELAAPWSRSVRGPGLWRIFPDGDHDGFTVQVLRRGRKPLS